MRKVTERLLVACVAALAVGACQDSVIVTEPPPPPPPPPPPSVDATVTIQGLRSIPGNAPVNPTAVAGDINVVLNVEEGDNTVTDIDLLFNGTPIDCQGISANEGPAGAPRLSGAADVVECFFNTDDVAGACVGDQLDPAFPNGQHTLGARITLSDGTTRDANNEQEITLVNSDFLMVVHEQGSQSVVSGGVTYFGGPADPDGDGTDDNLNSFAVCPVSYSGTVVAQLGLQPLQPVTNPIDLGAGPGATLTLAAPPFVFPVDPTDNDIASGNPVEDDVTSNGLNGGHVFTTAGTILDENGLNVGAQFAGASTGELFFDFTAPVPNTGGTSEVTVGGASVVPGTHYSAGAFGLTFVSENGVGFSFAAGAQVDVGDCATAANIDADPSTTFVTEVAGATGIPDHTEDDWEAGGDGFGAADAGGLDCYLAELQALADDLGNAFDLTTLAATIQNVTADLGADADADSYGADFTGPGLTNPQPDPATQPFVLNPDPNNDGVADPGDWTLMFDGADLALASGDPGAGIDETGCAAGGPCANITADVDVGPTGAPATAAVDNANTSSTDKGGTDDDFIVDIGFTAVPPGSNFPDGDYEITVTAPDLASPANPTTLTFTFTLDNTAPIFGALNPAPVGSGGTDASAIVMSIGGTIDDAHEITKAEISLFTVGSDAQGTGFTGAETCSAPGLAGLYKLDDTAGEVDRQDVDLTDGTNAIDFSGANAEAFNVPDPFGAGVGGTVRYCFVIDAEDNALAKDGTAAPNDSSLVTQVDVTWNP